MRNALAFILLVAFLAGCGIGEAGLPAESGPGVETSFSGVESESEPTMESDLSEVESETESSEESTPVEEGPLPDPTDPEAVWLRENFPKKIEGLGWGIDSLQMPGAVRIEGIDQQLGTRASRYFLDENTVLFLTSYLRYTGTELEDPPDNILAAYEYKIAEKQLRRIHVQEYPDEDVGGAVFISKYDQDSIFGGTIYGVFRLSYPDYTPLTEELEIMSVEEINAHLYQNVRPVSLVHPLEPAISMQDTGALLTFSYEDEQKERIHLQIGGEKFHPLLEQFPAGKFEVRHFAYSHSQPIGFGSIEFRSRYSWATALLLVNYETGEYYLSDFFMGNSDTNYAYYSPSDKKLVILVTDFMQYRFGGDGHNREAREFGMIIDIEEMLRHADRGVLK